MSSEDRTTEDTTQHADDVLGEQPNDPEKPVGQRVLTTTQHEALPTSCPSTTDGSISGYIEKNLQALAGPKTVPKLTFLPRAPSALCAG